MQNNPVIPDIPITEYPAPELPKVPKFWERKTKLKTIENYFMLTEHELAFSLHVHEQCSRLHELQLQVGEWAWRNFGEKSEGHTPTLGLIEEVGELAKAVLKKQQNIRGTPETHDANAIDAIGDIMIFLLNHLSQHQVSISGFFGPSRLDVVCCSHFESMSVDTLVLKLPHYLAALIEDVGNTAHFITVLEIISRFYGKTLIDITESTWEIVSKRDWRADSQTGGNYTHVAVQGADGKIG